MASYAPRVRNALIPGLRGSTGFLAVAFVFAALLLLLTPTLLSNRRRTKQWPLHTELSTASDWRRSPSAKHTSSNSAAEKGEHARFYSELRLASSLRLPSRRPALRGDNGVGAPKHEPAFTARTDDGTTVTKSTLISTDDYYGARVTRTRAADATSRPIYPPTDGDYSSERFVATRDHSSGRPAVAATSKTSPAMPTSVQAEPDLVSTIEVHATMPQSSTSASSSINRAGKATAAATVDAKKKTESSTHALERGGARSVVAKEATATTVGTAMIADGVPTVYIGFEKKGARLGNRMFQYASGLALALRYNRRAVLVIPNNTSSNLLDAMRRFFRLSTLPTLFTRPPLSTAVNLVESGWSRYDAARFDNASTFKRSVYTVGYFQSWKYFAPVADRVRREFTLTADAERAADAYFRSAGLLQPSKGSRGGSGVAAQPVRVGVHVRRGDMLRQSHQYTVAPAEYLLKAIAHYRKKYAAPRYNVSFVFATDDHAWVRDLVASRLPSELIVRYVSLDVGGDMAVLSRCDHSIVTGGTFGWWAAWLAGGDVVYYKDFIRPTSELYAKFSADDYYPPEWIGLSG